MDATRANALADQAAEDMRYRTEYRRQVGFVSLSATTSEDNLGGGRETTYRMHVKDLATNRMVPHLLGVAERGCEHMACEMVMLNSLVAGYMVEMGWSNDHSQQYALELLRANGHDLV
jgi:hypothetical protein